MTAFMFKTEMVAHLGRRTSVWCRRCRGTLGHYSDPRDARAEAEIHERKYHRETPGAA